MSSVQRSSSTSIAFAIGQNWPYVDIVYLPVGSSITPPVARRWPVQILYRRRFRSGTSRTGRGRGATVVMRTELEEETT